MNETKTFTLRERTNVDSYCGYEDIRYCSYCGNKAKRKDIGSSHNHRWEEDIIYSCECDNALEEVKIKDEAHQCKAKLRELEYKLEELEKLENNEIVNNMKFKKELENLKLKFNMKS